MWDTLKKFVFRALATVGLLTVLVILVGVFFLITTSKTVHKVSERAVLKIDMGNTHITEMPGFSDFSTYFIQQHISLHDLIGVIQKAAKDTRVKALTVKLDGMDLGLSDTYELRQAIAHFKESGKKAYAYCDTLGESNAALGQYYFASIFTELHMQPTGNICLTGLQADLPFAGKLLEEWGIKARIGTREEFKDAYAPFTEKEMPASMAESTKSMLANIYAELTEAIAKDREIDKESLEHYMQDSPILSDQMALKEGLVDKLSYYDRFEKMSDDLGKPIDVMNYAHNVLHENHDRGDSSIAIVYASGMLTSGQDEGFLGDSYILGSEEMRDAFDEIRKDGHVKAVVLRINSVGGSPAASETIWREVVRTQEKGIPVIASIGTVGASGGYWIATPCKKIVATPLTITGSIGVLMGKFVFKGFLEKLNVSVDKVEVGPNGSFWSSLQDYTEPQWNQIQKTLDATYGQFIQKVVKGRGLPQEHVRQVAKGRAWTGIEAKEFGLVDTLGSLEDAIVLAKKELKLSATAPIHTVVYPRPKPFLSRFKGAFTNVKINGNLSKIARVSKELIMGMQATQLRGPQVYALVPKI